MRSTGSGPMGALLMLAPLVAVPILAVVGIPQFAPGNLIDVNGPKSTASVRDNRELSAPAFGDDARHDADDLFAPLEESDAEIEEFEDPLGGRKPASRKRNSRLEYDDQREESSPRTRGGRKASAEDNLDQEFAGDFGSDLNTVEEEERGQEPRGRRRPHSKVASFEEENNAPSFEDFEDQKRDMAQPAGERFADASSDFGGGKLPTSSRARPSRQRESDLFESQDQDTVKSRGVGGNPFEEAPAATASPTKSKKKPAARPRDPHDAPLFQPEESEPEAFADNAASFEPPPAPKTPKTAPRSRPPVIPAELPEGVEELQAVPEVIEEPQVPGVDELTWQAATERLRTLGVGKSKHYFTYVEESNLFLFTCSAIHTKDPKKTVRFQAEAEEPLLAVRQVLAKLEAWQSSSTQRRVSDRGQQ